MCFSWLESYYATKTSLYGRQEIFIEPLLCKGYCFKKKTKGNITYNPYSQEASNLGLEIIFERKLITWQKGLIS